MLSQQPNVFSRLLRGNENWLFSFNNGLGNNELSALAWGGVSFGGLLSLLATLENIPSLFTWICVVNMALCGLTMYLLLSYLYGDKFSHILFSTSYALIGFNVVNCYQTLFFMGPQLLPLMVLGLVKLTRDESPLCYILSLGLCCLLNFYFAFHLCVLSVVLFFAHLCLHRAELKGKIGRLFGRWAAASFSAGLLGAVVWLPTQKAYSGGGRLDQTTLNEFTFSENMPFIQIFSKLFTGAHSTNEFISGFPNIFCGILVVALVILFFMDAQIRNIQYTIDAVRAAAALKCRVFVGAGSQAEYGRADAALTPETPCFPENGYGIAKLCAGQMSRVECEKMGINHIWLRILSVYGPCDGPGSMIMSTISKLLRGERPALTPGEQLWDYLYADDAARALVLMALHGKSGAVYPLGSGQSRPLRAYIEALRDVIDPALPLGLGEIPYSENQVMRLEANLRALTDDTGWRPETDFETGIRKTIEWGLRQHG